MLTQCRMTVQWHRHHYQLKIILIKAFYWQACTYHRVFKKKSFSTQVLFLLWQKANKWNKKMNKETNETIKANKLIKQEKLANEQNAFRYIYPSHFVIIGVWCWEKEKKEKKRGVQERRTKQRRDNRKRKPRKNCCLLINPEQDILLSSNMYYMRLRDATSSL